MWVFGVPPVVNVHVQNCVQNHRALRQDVLADVVAAGVEVEVQALVDGLVRVDHGHRGQNHAHQWWDFVKVAAGYLRYNKTRSIQFET